MSSSSAPEVPEEDTFLSKFLGDHVKLSAAEEEKQAKEQEVRDKVLMTRLNLSEKELAALPSDVRERMMEGYKESMKYFSAAAIKSYEERIAPLRAEQKTHDLLVKASNKYFSVKKVPDLNNASNGREVLDNCLSYIGKLEAENTKLSAEKNVLLSASKSNTAMDSFMKGEAPVELSKGSKRSLDDTEDTKASKKSLTEMKRVVGELENEISYFPPETKVALSGLDQEAILALDYFSKMKDSDFLALDMKMDVKGSMKEVETKVSSKKY